jgi:predicted phosphodiesterase
MARIRDLGELHGEVLLFGGPYSNLQATRALFARAAEMGVAPGNIICTGDVVAYCGNPVETVTEVRASGCAVLAGNCEINLAADAPDCGCGFAEGSACDRLAKDWYAFASARIGPEDRAWMAGLPDRITFRHGGQRWVVIHGGAGDVARFLWTVSFEDDFWHEISLLQEEVGVIDGVVAGHCGIPFQRRIDGIAWLNAGVIGMPPHDGGQDTAFAVLGDSGGRIEPLAYDVEGAVTAMRAAGLTQGYDAALETGYWPNEDILPKSMRR